MKGEASNVRWNSFFAFLSQIIRVVTTLVLFIGIARLYGVDSFGQFATAHTLSTIFLLLADFGFDWLLATEIARNREHAARLTSKYFSIKILFISSATALLFIFPYVHQFSNATNTLIQIFSLYVFSTSMNSFFFALFKGFEEFSHETWISFVINSLLLILLVILGLFHVPLHYVALCFVMTRFLGVALSIPIARRLVDFQIFRLDFKDCGKLVKRVVVFGSQYLFGNLFFLFDTVLLALLCSDREVGIYQSAFKIITLSLIIPDIAVNAMMPVLTRFHRDDIWKWNNYGQLLYKILFLVSLPVALIIFVFPEQIIQVLYGGDYLEAIPILRLFSVVILIRYGADAYALMLTTSQRQFVRMLIVAGGTIINIALNTWLIPLYGVLGAAIVSLVTNTVVALGYMACSRVSIIKWSFEFRCISLFGFSLFLGMAIWNFRFISIWFLLPPIIILFAVLIYFLGLSQKERIAIQK
ncbi:MAG: flippase [Bacteroidetes bacterium]|nr:flippase [Bacteroidota bacterium]